MDGNIDLSEGVIDRSIREQNRFLDYCVLHAVAVTIFLNSGANFTGIIIDHDRKCILLGSTSTTRPKDPKVFMKSYICLIRPSVAIELFIQYRGMGTALKRKKAMKKARKNAKRENKIPNAVNAYTGARDWSPDLPCKKRTLRVSAV